MKIAIADNNGLKFIKDLKEHWEEVGHEVRYERGASEHLAQWADVYFIDTSDNNVYYLWKFYTNQHPPEMYPNDWDNKKRPKFVVRALDWEVYLGKARDQVIVDFIDQWVCIAPHIEEKLRREADFGDKLKLIRPGVNLDKFTLKETETDGFQIGMVLGDLWWYKNHMGGLDIFATLAQEDPRWRLHIRGQHEPGEYNPVMFDHYLESRGIKDKVTLYGPVDDMNQWLENIDILLHPGMKEAFCYAVGEAMAKGIPAVINEFYGAKDIWSVNDLYQTHAQAVRKIKWWQVIDVNRPVIRKTIQQSYSNEQMFKEFDELIESL